MHAAFTEDLDESVTKALSRWADIIEATAGPRPPAAKSTDWIEFEATILQDTVERRATHLKWEDKDLILRFEDGTEARFRNAWPSAVEGISDAVSFNHTLTVKYDFDVGA